MTGFGKSVGKGAECRTAFSGQGAGIPAVIGPGIGTIVRVRGRKRYSKAVDIFLYKLWKKYIKKCGVRHDGCYFFVF